MHRIVIDDDKEYYDQQNNEFFTIKRQILELEHSLISLSKWESKWKKPFLDNLQRGRLSPEETIDYIRCMTINKNVDDRVYYVVTDSQMESINNYINDPMTATTISDFGKKTKSNHEILTSELIYYYMITAGIPCEFEKWHLNRLIMLIQVFGAKSEKPKKMSQRELYSRNAAINAANRAKYKSKG